MADDDTTTPPAVVGRRWADDDSQPDDEGYVSFDGAAPDDADLPAYNAVKFEAEEWEPPEWLEAAGGNGTYTVEDGADLAEATETAEVNGNLRLIEGYVKDEPHVHLSGGAEPLLVPNPDTGEDGIVIAWPMDDGQGWKAEPLGKWECTRCGTQQRIPPGPRGELEEPYECQGCERQGPFKHVGSEHVEEGSVEMLAEPFWLPPRNVKEDGFEALYDDVRQWIYDHWVVEEESEYLYDGLAAWVISSWLRPNFDELAHVVVMGQFQGGKTRLLNTLREVVYRGATLVDQTAAFLYRAIDTYGATFMLSEYHDLDQETQKKIDGVFKGSQKRGEGVGRLVESAGGWVPKNFDIFSNMGIATQYQIADDMISRSIQIHTSRAHRPVPDRIEAERGAELRSRLLYARWRLLDAPEWDEAEKIANEFLEERDISGRTKEKLWAIVTVGVLWDCLDQLEDFVVEMDKAAKRAAAESTDALVVRILRDIAFDKLSDMGQVLTDDPFAEIEIPYKEIVDQFNRVTGQERTAAWYGHVAARHGLEVKRKNTGTVIKDPDLRDKLKKLCDDNGIDWRVDPEDVGLTRPEKPEKGESDIIDPKHWVGKVISEDYKSGEEFTVSEVAGKVGQQHDINPTQAGHAIHSFAKRGGPVNIEKLDEERFRKL